MAYLQSASLAKYLLECYGVDTLRRIWKDGADAIPAATGEDLESLERNWRKAVQEK